MIQKWQLQTLGSKKFASGAKRNSTRKNAQHVSVVNDVLNTLIKTVSVRKGRVIPRLRCRNAFTRRLNPKSA